MNGRVYDPYLGRFISADSVIQSLGATQSINPYAYAWNDPLRYVDPSGHSLLGDILGIVVGIIVAYFLPEIAPEYFASMTSMSTLVVAGFVGGFVGAYVSTGNLSVALTAGVIAGITAAAFAEVGSYVSHMQVGSEWETKAVSILAHSAVGCGSAMLSGGNCGKGALAAGLTEAANQEGWIESPGKQLASWGTFRGTVEAGLIGGSVSSLVGGKFDDGFSVAAAGYLFNSVAHSRKAVPFTDDNGNPVTDINGDQMLRPADVSPGDMALRGEWAAPGADLAGLSNFRIGGPWDWQRVGSGLVFTREFTDFSNVSIGIYAAAAGIPEDVTLSIANAQAARNSNFGTNWIPDANYPSLRVQNVYDIRLGYSLYNSGAIKSPVPAPNWSTAGP